MKCLASRLKAFLFKWTDSDLEYEIEHTAYFWFSPLILQIIVDHYSAEHFENMYAYVNGVGSIIVTAKVNIKLDFEVANLMKCLFV